MHDMTENTSKGNTERGEYQMINIFLSDEEQT